MKELKTELLWHIAFVDPSELYEYITVDYDGAVWTWTEIPRLEQIRVGIDMYYVWAFPNDKIVSHSCTVGRRIFANDEHQIDMHGVEVKDAFFGTDELLKFAQKIS